MKQNIKIKRFGYKLLSIYYLIVIIVNLHRMRPDVQTEGKFYFKWINTIYCFHYFKLLGNYSSPRFWMSLISSYNLRIDIDINNHYMDIGRSNINGSTTNSVYNYNIKINRMMIGVITNYYINHYYTSGSDWTERRINEQRSKRLKEILE